ncbi:hypothetical protein Q7P37_004831 [Cladosporium fusiforme]
MGGHHTSFAIPSPCAALTHSSGTGGACIARVTSKACRASQDRTGQAASRRRRVRENRAGDPGRARSCRALVRDAGRLTAAAAAAAAAAATAGC